MIASGQRLAEEEQTWAAVHEKHRYNYDPEKHPMWQRAAQALNLVATGTMETQVQDRVFQ
jgi:hypothetical protein